jgi:DNA repair protein RadA
MTEVSLDIDLSNLKGVGPKTRQKLIDGGIQSIMDLAVALPREIEDILGGKEEKAFSFIISAKRSLEQSGLLDKEFIPAGELLQKRRNMMRCTTGSNNLNKILSGGVETQAITEVYGDFGSGKTQLCHTLCCTCQLQPGEGGLGGGAIYIDTESTFRPERLYQIAQARGLDPDKIINNVTFCKVYNSSHLELVIKVLGKHIERCEAKLVIVDSVISLHRAEFMGRGTLAERQQRLNSLIHRLLRFAEIYNIAVVVTNQVQTKPDTFFGDPTKPTGGNVIAHACTYRIYLKKAGKDRIATIVDSPYHPYIDARFTLTEAGVTDPEGS